MNQKVDYKLYMYKKNIYLKKVSLFTCLVFVVLKSIIAQPGTNDFTFNTYDDGTLGNGTGLNNTANSIAIQADHKIIIGGFFTSFNGTARNYLARLNTNGSLDKGFNPGTGFDSGILSISIQVDGKIIVGGEFTSFNGTSRNRIARLNPDGSLDTGFNPGTGFDSGIHSISIQTDGKIIVVGNFSSFNGTARNSIARLNADGSLDSGFDPGTGFNNTAYSIAIQADGKIIVGGNFSSFNGTARYYTARLNADGSLDTSFDLGTGFNSIVFSISIQADGKIIMGGAFTSFNGTARNLIARLNANGSLDTGFNPTTGFVGNTVNSTTLQTDGKIIAGGFFYYFNGTTRNKIARLNADGSLDTGFDPESGFDGTVYSTAIQADGKIIAGGIFNSFNGIERNYLARLNTNGSLEIDFNPTTGFDGTVNTTTLQTDGKIIVGGEFSTFNGTARSRIARLNTDGSLDTVFDPGKGFNSFILSTAIQADGKIIVGGAFSSFNGTARNGIARLNSDGSLDTGFNPGTGFDSWVASTTIQSNGKIIVGGYFSSFNGTARNYIARLNVDGSLDTGFNPGTGFDGIVNSNTIQADGKIIIGGGFTYFNGTNRNFIARLNADGSIDTGFNPGTGFDNWVVSTAIQMDGKIIVGGHFSSINGTARNRITRLNNDGSLDTSFNPATGFDNWVTSTAIQTDGKIILGGEFSSFNGTARNRIARLNANGSLDTGFNPGTGFYKIVRSTTIQPDSKIIVGGQFFSFNGIFRNRIARLNGDCNITLDLTTGLNGNTITSNESGAAYQWIDCSNNQPINGATNQSYTAIANGNYACIVTKYNCISKTACVNVTITGIQVDAQASFIIYPNPNNGIFVIKDVSAGTYVTVTNSLGRVIFNTIFINNTQVINLSNQPVGIYHIQLISQNKIESARIVIH